MEEASIQTEASWPFEQDKWRAISLRIGVKSKTLRSLHIEAMSSLFGALDLLKHATLHYMLYVRRIRNNLPLYVWQPVLSSSWFSHSKSAEFRRDENARRALNESLAKLPAAR
jgi:hypothetical protein